MAYARRNLQVPKSRISRYRGIDPVPLTAEEEMATDILIFALNGTLKRYTLRDFGHPECLDMNDFHTEILDEIGVKQDVLPLPILEARLKTSAVGQEPDGVMTVVLLDWNDEEGFCDLCSAIQWLLKSNPSAACRCVVTLKLAPVEEWKEVVGAPVRYTQGRKSYHVRQ